MGAKIVVPHSISLFILDELQTYFVLKKFILKDESNNFGKVNSMLNVTKVENGLKRDAKTFLATLLEIKLDRMVKSPDEVAELLGRFADVMTPELLKELPPRRAIDHKTKLVPSSRPPARAPYLMSPLELAELRKQLNELRAWSRWDTPLHLKAGI